MKKFLILLALGAFSSSVLANSSLKEIEKKFYTSSVKAEHYNMVSVQPAIITDEECAKIFGSITFSKYRKNYRSDQLDITHRKVSFKAINEKLTARFVQEFLIIRRPGKPVLKTPGLVSYQMNNETLEANGVFFNDYCRGDVRTFKSE